MYELTNCNIIPRARNFDTKVVMHFSTLYWISALFLTTTVIFQGGTRVFSNNSTDGEAILHAAEKYQITLMFAAPLITYSLTSVKDITRFYIPSFRHLLTGGTNISNQQLNKLRSILKKTKVFLCYGQSETGVLTTFDVNTETDVFQAKIKSSGKLAINSSLKVSN